MSVSCAGGVNECKREDSFGKCGNCSIGFELKFSASVFQKTLAARVFVVEFVGEFEVLNFILFFGIVVREREGEV